MPCEMGLCLLGVQIVRGAFGLWEIDLTFRVRVDKRENEIDALMKERSLNRE